MYWQVQECRRSRCAKGYAAPAAILGLCPDCNTYPLLKLTAIFPPTECLTAPASYCPRAVRRGDEHRTWTSVPLRDALLGDWVLFRRRVRYSSARDQGPSKQSLALARGPITPENLRQLTWANKATALICRRSASRRGRK